MQMLYIGLFGALGCVARYVLSGWVYDVAGRALPWGTLAVNVLGSFLIGVVMEESFRSALVPPQIRLGIAIGFFGGFTTFSTFSYETVRLLEEGSILQAGANLLLSVVACIVATIVGIAAARCL